MFYMKPIVTQGAMLECGFGNAPAPIMVLPDKKVKSIFPVAVKSDHVPLLNILPFGMCSNPANPMVAAATAAAFGVLTPVPCIPCTLRDWTNPCRKVKVHGKEAIHTGSGLQCLYGGSIKVTVPVQPAVIL